MGSRLLNPGLHVHLLCSGARQYDSRFVIAPHVRLSSSILSIHTYQSHRNTPDHRRLPEPQRHRLVWLLLPDRANGTPADLRPLLCILQHQVGVLPFAGYLRTRLCHLSSRTKLDGPHNREGRFRRRRCRLGERDDNYPLILCRLEDSGKALAHCLGHVQHWICHWTPCRRFYNRQQGSYLAVCVLDQPP